MEKTETKATILITDETKQRINLENYNTLTSDHKQNVLCAMMVCFYRGGESPISADLFFAIYQWWVTTLYQGVVVDFDTCPDFRDTQLLRDAEALRGNKDGNLLDRQPVMRIAEIISNNDKAFLKEVEARHTYFEQMVLLSAFMPGVHS